MKLSPQLEAPNRPHAEDVTKHLFHVRQTAVCGDTSSAIERNSDQIDLGLQVELQHLIIWRAVSGFDAARLEEKQILAEVRFMKMEQGKEHRPPLNLLEEQMLAYCSYSDPTAFAGIRRT